MKKLISIGMAITLVVSLLTSVSILSSAEDYSAKTGYAKVWDFESWNLGEVQGNGGDPAVSPIRANGGYTATITDEWNYSGDTGKSIKFDSEQAKEGCICFEHKRPEISFATTAYNALLFEVKTPKAPSTDANEKGYSIALSLNDWGVYYKTSNNNDIFQIQKKGSKYWEDVKIQDKVMYVPYAFEGIIKLDMACLYKGDLADDATVQDYDNARLKDKEIQHEVVIEMWLPKSTGGDQGAFYIDDMYLRTPDATDTFDKQPEPSEETKGGAVNLSDFEEFEAGSTIYDENDLDNSAVWNSYGYTVKASDQFIGNGKVSAEFSSDTNRQTWGILSLMKTGDGIVTDKNYIIMHIATPSNDSSKGSAYEDSEGNKRFAFAILPKTETKGAGHWFKTDSTVAGNVRMMADGEATWKAIPGDDFYNYLPFGWSGWIIYKMDSFKEGTLSVDGTSPLTGIEVYTSQAGGRFGKVYLDSLYAIDNTDELESGISAAGNKNGKDSPSTNNPSSSGNNNSEEPYIPSSDSNTNTESDITTDNNTISDVPVENNFPTTGDMSSIVITMIIMFISISSIAILGKKLLSKNKA